MPDWLQTFDWVAAAVLGLPSALLAVLVIGFYILRPSDAAFLGMAGPLALMFAGIALVPAILFALAAWGGARQASWAPWVQALAILVGLVPALMLFRAATTAAARRARPRPATESDRDARGHPEA
jgi:hypothetical protein